MRAQQVQLRVSLTGRYATALYKEALAAKSIETILHDVESFKEILKHNPELDHIMQSQFLQTKSGILIMEEVGKLMNFSTLFINFLKALIKNRRGSLINEIFNKFIALIDAQTDTTPIRIEIAKINKLHLAAIEKMLKETHKSKSYRFEHHQNPELLGGFRAFIYEQCLDYSLNSRLNRLLHQLKEA